ncbi:MAG: RNA polymerase sigma factor [Ktedonobacteraceae bacterium]|nr:RNA polymerase sigma factor [Ktedonobacteraceae bacterium]
MIKPNSTCAQSAELSDTVLISQTLAGDDRAFEVLMQRYHLQLYNFIGRCLKDYELAHDVLQFVFMQLYISLPKLEHNLHSKRTKTPLKSWLFQVAWNRCMDELRRRRSILFSELDLLDEDEEMTIVNIIPDAHPLPEEIAEHHELQTVLAHAIQKLPPRLRSVVSLRYAKGLSFVEIGRVLNMPENTAKTYFQRARPLLRSELALHS